MDFGGNVSVIHCVPHDLRHSTGKKGKAKGHAFDLVAEVNRVRVNDI